jgi:hypothetical protein
MLLEYADDFAVVAARDLQNVAEALCSRSNYVESVHVEQPEGA